MNEVDPSKAHPSRVARALDASCAYLEELGKAHLRVLPAAGDIDPVGWEIYRAASDRHGELVNASLFFEVAMTTSASRELLPQAATCLRSYIQAEDTPPELAAAFQDAYGSDIEAALGTNEPTD